MSKRGIIAGSAVAFAATGLYRWLTIDFTNDHFVHVSRARQILVGDVPVRDFFDPGLILQYYASAAALHLSGGTLLGEAILTVFFVALGGALTFALAARVSGSWLTGALAAAIVMIMFPRLYSYPKVALFVLALCCMWRYADGRSKPSLIVLSLVTAIAFLFRHDHGVYIGVAVLAFLLALHGMDIRTAGARPMAAAVATYTAATFVALLPFLAFIQSTAGLVDYVRGSTPQIQSIATPRLNMLPLRIDWSAPLGMLTDENALAWLYYLTLLLPVAGLLLLLRDAVVPVLRGTASRISSAEASIAGAAIVLCVVVGQTLIRESPDSRLPDIAPPVAVLGAWVAGRWIAGSGRGRAFRRILAAAVAVVTIWAAGNLGLFGQRLQTSGFASGPSEVRDRLVRVNASLLSRPIYAWAGPDSVGIRALTQYVMDCITPADRLLVAWLEPEVFFYAERAFAGGQVYLHPGWHSSIADQRLTIERLQRQRVPIVLTNVALNERFRTYFPLVYDYVHRHYTLAAQSTFGSNTEYGVFTHRDIASLGTYEPLGLPCFR